MRKLIKKLIKEALLKYISFISFCRFKLSLRRKILFYGLNPMNYTMFKPLHKRIEAISNNDVFFCFKAADNNYAGYVRLGVPPQKILSLNKARTRVWDAIVFADFYTPNYLFGNNLIQIYHGVAAKNFSYRDKGNDSIKDYRYHPYLKYFDTIFFINKTDYANARNKNLFKKDDSGEIVGMCCLDDVMRNSTPEKKRETRLKYVTPEFGDKKVVLYAPTWDETASFKRKGQEILEALSVSDCFLIVKPHPLCITSTVGRSGMDLAVFLKEKFPQKNYFLVTDTPYEVMPIADMMISDFSSISFEFTLLRKPIYLFEGNEIQKKIADNEQYEMLKRCCFVFKETDTINKDIFKYEELEQDRIEAMENIQRKYFSNVGHATETAVNKLIERKIINF